MVDIKIDGKAQDAKVIDLGESPANLPTPLKSTDALSADQINSEETTKYINQLKDEYDQPFFDEILVRCDDSKNNKNQFYVVRLFRSTDSIALKGKSVEINGLNGTVVGAISDESANPSYFVSNIDMEFGMFTSDGQKVTVDPKKYGIEDVQKFKTKFFEALNKIGQDKDRVTKVSLTEGGSLNDGQLFELRRAGGIAEKVSATMVHEIMDVYTKIAWNKEHTALVLTFCVSPPPRKAHLIINGDASIAPKYKEIIRKKIESFLKKDVLSKDVLIEARKNITEYFTAHPQFFLGKADPAKNATPDNKVTMNINKTGELDVTINLKPLPQKISVDVNIIDAQSKLAGNEKFDSNQGKLPFKILSPYNETNIDETIENLKQYYGNRGYFVSSNVKYEIDEKGGHLSISVIQLQKGIEYDGTGGPSQKEMEGMFLDTKLGVMTNASRTDGLEKLKEWCDGKGYLLRPGEPAVFFNHGKPVVSAHPLVLDKAVITYIYTNDDTGNAESKEFEVGTDVSSLPYNFLKEFDFKPGDFFNVNSFNEALARIKRNYPVDFDPPTSDSFEPSSNPQKNKDRSVFKFKIYDHRLIKTKGGGNPQGMIGGGVTWIDGQARGNFNIGAGYRLLDGQQLNLNYGLQTGENYSTHQYGANFHLPWLTDINLSLDAGLTGLNMNYDEHSYDSYGAYTNLTIPLWSHSALAAITGLGLSVNLKDKNYDSSWFVPMLGIQYLTANTRILLTNRLGASDAGDMVYKANLKAFQHFRLTSDDKLGIDLKFSSGIAAPIRGNIPMAQLFTSLDMVPGFGPMLIDTSLSFASLRADLMYKAATYLDIGLGTSGTLLSRITGGEGNNYDTESVLRLGGGVIIKPKIPFLFPDGIPFLLGWSASKISDQPFGDPVFGVNVDFFK